MWKVILAIGAINREYENGLLAERNLSKFIQFWRASYTAYQVWIENYT